MDARSRRMPGDASISAIRHAIESATADWLLVGDNGQTRVSFDVLVGVVHEICHSLADLTAQRDVAARYRDLAREPRQNLTDLPAEVATALLTTADSLDRRAQRLSPTGTTAVDDPSATVLTSFGYAVSDGTIPDADLIVDTRTLGDPAGEAESDIHNSDGRDPRVQAAILRLAGAQEALETILAAADRTPSADRPQWIAVGSDYGRHRAVAIVELAADQLRAVGIRVLVDHRHVHLPRDVDSASMSTTEEPES
jgi:RNase adaptor protein for sRNA GlmZ degradation